MQPIPDDLSDDQIEVFQQALEYYHAALHYRANGELADAMVAFRNCVALYPSATAHTLLGELYALVQRYEDAITECRRALDCEPNFGEAFVRIGICYNQMEEDDKAIEAFRCAGEIEGYDGRVRALFAMASGLEKALRWQEAYDAFERCAVLDPTMSEAGLSMHRMLGHLN